MDGPSPGTLRALADCKVESPVSSHVLGGSFELPVLAALPWPPAAKRWSRSASSGSAGGHRTLEPTSATR